MSGESALDPRTLTFSQANGYEELPQPLKLGELSNLARVKLWGVLYDQVRRASGFNTRGSVRTSRTRFVLKPWASILVALHEDFHELPIDEFDIRFESFISSYKPILLEGSLGRVFDLLQEVMRHRECPREFIDSLATVFNHCRLAYVVDTCSPVTIYPAATKEEGEVVLQAIADLSNMGLAGAVSHLRQASESINQGDYPGAVRESIHAVESTARQTNPHAKTLEPALKSLEGAGGLHPALKRAFSNLYGYTSDEQGIRHALIDNPQPNVGQDEAVFMLGACASFSSYLARKHRQQAS